MEEIDNKIPIYVQIQEKIIYDIVSGKLQMGQKIESVREMSVKMQVNPNTIQKALSKLEKTNLVTASSTSGRYVTCDKELIEKYKNSICFEIASNTIKSFENIGIEDKEKIIEYIKNCK